IRACRKYWLTAVSSLVSTAFRCRTTSASPFMAPPSALSDLLRGVEQGSLSRPDHALHIADTFGALGLALAMTKDIRRPPGAAGDGGPGVALSNAIAVADVHGPARLRTTRNLYAMGRTLLQLIRMRARRNVGLSGALDGRAPEPRPAIDSPPL